MKESKNEVLISVIVPIYNVSGFLRKCLDSLIYAKARQLEFILVDDGSTDGSEKICDEYLSLDSRVRVIHKTNGGLVSARKAGSAAACGEYILNVDGDDYLVNNALDYLTKLLVDKSFDVLCFRLQMETQKGVSACPLTFSSGKFDKARIERDIFPLLIRAEDDSYIRPNLATKVIRRTIYSQVQEKVDDRIIIGEDAACSIPAIYLAESLYVVDKVLYCYRYNNNSLTKRKKAYSFEDPRLLKSSIEKTVDLAQRDFSQQLARKVSHELFVISSTQFDGSKSFHDTALFIKEQLNSEDYCFAIKNCKYRGNALSSLSLFALKKKCCFLFWLYGLVR